MITEMQRESREGPITETMQRQAEKVPTDLFLWGAGASIATALVLKATKRDHGALFVGQWVAPFLLLGILNRMARGNKNCGTE